MKKRVTALLLSLGLMSTLTVSAVSSDTSGVTPQIAKAYLNVVDQQVNRYGGYTTTKDYPMDAGFAGGFVRDFDRDGTPELYVVGVEQPYQDYAQKAYEQIWTWTGNRAKLLCEEEYDAFGIRAMNHSMLCIVDGITYYRKGYSGYPGPGSGYHNNGKVCSVQGSSWKEIMSYYWYDPDDGFAPNETTTYEITVNGMTKSYYSEAAYLSEIEKYVGKSPEILVHEGAGFLSIGFNPNGRALRNQLSQLAANQPSSWAKAEVDAAKAAGLVPALTGNPGYQNSITRQQFAELVVTLVEQATGKTLEAAPADTFSDCTSLAVRKASAAGIVNGMGDGLFAPGQTTNREQIATMVNRAIQYIKAETGTDLTPVKGSISKFADKSSVSSWAVEGVGALAANGIMNGTSSTQLSPKATCTVEQSILLSFRTFEKLP